MKRLSYLVALVFCFLSTELFSQVGMNQWRIHFSNTTGIGIAQDVNSIYMACANGIVQYHTDDNSIETLTAVNGLSDLGISTIDGNGTIVFVGYQNGNIDIINGNEITNVPWIKLADIAGDKSINSFYFNNDFAYISSGIGLVVYDLKKKEIKETYYPYSNPSVNASCVLRDTLYLATENGIYFAPKAKPFLNDLNSWTKKTDLPSGVVNGPFSEIVAYQDKLLFGYNSSDFDGDTLYYIQNNTLNRYPTKITLNDLRADDEFIYLSVYGSVQIINSDMSLMNLIFAYNAGVPDPLACLKKGDWFWIADRNFGLVRAKNSWDNEVVYSNSPYRDGCYRLDIQYGKVLVAGGGLTHNLVNNYYRNGVYVFENEQWTNFNHITQPNIDFNKDWDFVSVAVNPNNTDQFAFSGDAQGGLKIVTNGTEISQVYDASNSMLEENGTKIAIGDMKYDEAGNLWMVSTGIEPLKVLTPTGEWYSFSLGSAAKNKYPYRMIIDNDGNKWVGVTNAGMIAFNENGTLADQTDDDIRVFTTSEGFGNLPSVFVKGIAEDLDGEIWAGTEAGLVILYSKNNLYDGEYGEYDFKPILIEVDEEVETLFGTTYITAIAVDGGNRKWIGTSSSGVFCVSPDGLTEIYRFTTENSPLISNNILDVRIDHLSGEVYFATDKGLVSFRSDASLFDEEFSSVTVFPNPVRPDFSGPITIQGLGYQADVKVTDISGNLVFKTVSNGGTAIWDGKTLNGDRVQSGVYLIWSASPDGKGKNVSKLLFLN